MGINIKGILLGLIAIVVAMGMMGAVYARTDCPEEPKCGPNQPLDLKLKDQDEPWRDGVTSTWVARNMAPGDEYAFEGCFVGLRSNVKGRIGITCAYQVKEEVPPAESDTDHQTNLHPDKMTRQLIITRCLYKNSSWQIDCLTGRYTILPGNERPFPRDCTDAHWQIQDIDRDGRITFYDLKSTPLSGLPLPASASTEGARFVMSVKFAGTAGNDLQGDTLNLTMYYTLTPWLECR